MKSKSQKFKSLFFLLALLGLLSCERKESTSFLPSNPEEVGDSLWGIDDDHSGVRDDVEEWIKSSSYADKEKLALHFLARQYQGILLTGSGQEDANRVVGEYIRALDCLNLTFGPERARDVRETLKRVQFNTPKRIARFRETSKHFSPDKIKPLESYRDRAEVCPF